MWKITYIDIQQLINNNINIDTYINEVYELIKKYYQHFTKWFKNNVISDLYEKKRNIIIAYKEDNIYGFVILKKLDNERTISNLYIENNIFQRKIMNELLDRSITWLETPTPKLIISKNNLSRFADIIIKKNWYLSNKLNMNNSIQVIFNGDENEFERLVHNKTLLKK